MSLVLIDTSIWIDLLRGTAHKGHLARMQLLLENGDAAWCGMIQLELWSGVRDSKERKQLSSLGSAVRELEISELAWKEACLIAGAAHSKGITAPASDQLIFACARVNKAEIWHSDRHFDLLAKL